MLFSFSTNSQLGYVQFYNTILVYDIISYKTSCRKPSAEKRRKLDSSSLFFLPSPCTLLLHKVVISKCPCDVCTKQELVLKKPLVFYQSYN